MPTIQIEPGWTLLETTEGTQINLPEVGLTPFTGVPFGAFNFRAGHLGDFGRGLGRRKTSRTDAIAKRLVPAVTEEIGATITIPVELVGLQLRSVNPVGGPFKDQHVFVTLQSMRGGPQTLGVMAIRFDSEAGGSFSTMFQVYFDMRVGSLDSQPLSQRAKSFFGRETTWQRVAPSDAKLLPRINSKLSDAAQLGSFFPGEILIEATNDDTHAARVAT